jgi:hypothetical protein
VKPKTGWHSTSSGVIKAWSDVFRDEVKMALVACFEAMLVHMVVKHVITDWSLCSVSQDGRNVR